MRKIALVFVGLMAAGRLLAGACTATDTRLCLNSSRFEVAVHWQDTKGRSGDGHAVSLTADTGYFWFFSPSNVELVVKVLDARSVNGKYWVFFGALSNVEYDLQVKDTVTGAVKTYNNPQGQFASVGDTGAFAGSVTAPSKQETVAAQGSSSEPESIEAIQRFIDSKVTQASEDAAADFAPCSDDGPGLLLASCRFRVEVHWADSHGRFGTGQPVQLTADTGYFWFFADTNVELVVKVLDARSVNGSFWVFFGALSNVEYTVAVTDTVSGQVRTYHNPSGAFASTGDTSAFRGGFGATIVNDDALAVRGTITAAGGGSISAAATDGTVFTLTVPADAVASDQDVVMTPVHATGAFPFAAGLAAGVDLQPAGLFLLTGARLSIHTPAPISRAEETPVAWNGSGQDFFLYPPLPSGGDLALEIAHLGGYGVARGTDAERTAQLAKKPVADEDLLAHETSPILRAGRAQAASLSAGGAVPKATADWKADYKDALDAAYSTSLLPQMLGYDGEPAGLLPILLQVQAWEIQVLTIFAVDSVDAVFPGRAEEIQLQLTKMAKRAIQVIHTRCKGDVSYAVLLPTIAHLAQTLELDVAIDLDEAIQCLTFQLHFESQIQNKALKITGATVSVATVAVAADVTLTTAHYSDDTKGQGTLNFTSGTVAPLPKSCSYVFSSGGVPFIASIAWPNLYNGSGSIGLEKLYYGGIEKTNEELTITCNSTPKVVIPLVHPFGAVYEVNHPFNDDSKLFDGYWFSESGFTQNNRENPWATKTIHIEDPETVEDTKFTIVHTPQ